MTETLADMLERERRYKNPYLPEEWRTGDGLAIHAPSRTVIDKEGHILQQHASLDKVKLLWKCYRETGERTPQAYTDADIVRILSIKRFHWTEAGRKLAVRDRLLKIETFYCVAPSSAEMLCDTFEEKFPCPPEQMKDLVR